MKRRILLKLGICLTAAFVVGVTAYGQQNVMLQTRTAGSATVLEAVPEREMLAGAAAILENEPSRVPVHKGTKEKSIILPEETAKTQEKESLWGYTNLGIAHVDNHLNIRETPGEDGKLVGKMPKNTACEILSEEDGWAKIKSGKVEGYVSMEFLYTQEDAREKAKEVVSTTAIVNTQTLKVRGEPSTDSIVLTLVPIEEELEVVEVLDGWAKIMLDDEEAYVSLDYVDIVEKLGTAVTLTELKYGQGVSDVRVGLVQFAQKYVGNPYVWGGVSLTNGADCSGFVLSVYKNFGISLPHSSRAQAGYGTKISPSEAQPGDLFFYAKNGTINHVAIYIGGGKVVHASSPKTGIKISNSHYRTPYAVRRILS